MRWRGCRSRRRPREQARICISAPPRCGRLIVCNLYGITKGQKAIRDLANAMIDKAGNMLSVPGVVPNRVAPVVRSAPKPSWPTRRARIV